MKLSPHFTLAEFTRSDIALRKGIDNTPPPAIVNQLERTAAGLERVRELLRCPIHVSSGYRSPAVNAAVGGSKTSQHVKGEAVDFTSPGYGTPRMICMAIVTARQEIGFDQLIFEGGWVHISFVDHVPRNQVLTAHFEGGRATYTQGVA